MIIPILFLVFLLSSVIESTVISLPLTLFIVIYMYVYDWDMALPVSFFSGVLIDLFSHRLLGSSSLLFVLGYGFWISFSRKIHVSTSFYEYVFLIVMTCMYHILIYRGLYFPNLVRDLLIGLLVLFLLEREIPKSKKSHKLSL